MGLFTSEELRVLTGNKIDNSEKKVSEEQTHSVKNKVVNLTKNPGKLHKLLEEEIEDFFTLLLKKSKTEEDFIKLQSLFKKSAWNCCFQFMNDCNIKRQLHLYEAVTLIIHSNKKLSNDELLDYFLLQLIYTSDAGEEEEARERYIDSKLGDLNRIIDDKDLIIIEFCKIA